MPETINLKEQGLILAYGLEVWVWVHGLLLVVCVPKYQEAHSGGVLPTYGCQEAERMTHERRLWDTNGHSRNSPCDLPISHLQSFQPLRRQPIR